VYDLSSHGNHGTLGGGTAGYCPTWVTEKFGSALSFNGSDDYIDIGDKPDFKFTTENFTISFWAFIKDYDEVEQVPIGKGTPNELSPYFFWLLGDSTHQLRFYVRDSDNTTWYHNDYEIPTENEWYFVAAVKNGTNQKLYINGIEESSYFSPATILDDSRPLTIGSGWGTSAELTFYGLINRVMIYNRELSADEVWQLYTDPFCMFYHPLEAELLYAAAPSAVGTPTLTLLGVGR